MRKYLKYSAALGTAHSYTVLSCPKLNFILAEGPGGQLVTYSTVRPWIAIQQACDYKKTIADLR